MKIIETIAKELSVHSRQVEAAVALMDEGATVPFIARYRKEKTGNLDDVQLRSLEKRLHQLRDFQARQTSILQSIEKQGLLTDALKSQILATESKTRLEDLYLPYKPKRRSKATLAKEAGLEPLAVKILQNHDLSPTDEAQAFINTELGITDAEAALAGAQDILIDIFCVDAVLLSQLRRELKQTAIVTSNVVKNKKEEAGKFEDYFSYSELLRHIPSHRALALFRGQHEGYLRVKLVENGHAETSMFIEHMSAYFKVFDKHAKGYAFLQETLGLAWQKLLKRFQADFFQALREKAENESVHVFGENLRDLMLAPPAGQRATLGLDPGIRTGVKVAVVDQHGKLLETAVIYPHQPQNRWQESIAALAVLADKYKFELVAIGNGTGARETEKLVNELIEKFPNFKLTPVIVSEAGASVYSASEQASKEFPNIDVSLRGAVSIARRLQDPLAELVKIEPKAIGVGQYQHDVNQSFLDKELGAVVEDCVNYVGVDVNTASAELLSYVSGLNKKIAAEIVKERDEKGAFASREALKKIKGVGPKSFEQAAGFLRILDGKNPLDASAVHPESYVLVENILSSISAKIKDVMGHAEVLSNIEVSKFANDLFGEETVKDVLSELEKPGRDPRPTFKTAKFKSGVNEVRDLRPGMKLEGVVSNVTNFGAFVDVGVHQDGLVHISALANQFVDDPRKVVKAGQIVQVKVLDVDNKRKRISLTMRLTDEPEIQTTSPNQSKTKQPKLQQTEPKHNKSIQTRGKPQDSKKGRRKQTASKSAVHKPRKESSTQQQIQKKLKQQAIKKGGKPQAENAFALAFAKALEK